MFCSLCCYKVGTIDRSWKVTRWADVQWHILSTNFQENIGKSVVSCNISCRDELSSTWDNCDSSERRLISPTHLQSPLFPWNLLMAYCKAKLKSSGVKNYCLHQTILNGKSITQVFTYNRGSQNVIDRAFPFKMFNKRRASLYTNKLI
jgi:hypothetical protein